MATSSQVTPQPTRQASADTKAAEVKEAPPKKLPEEKELPPETPEQIQAQCQGFLRTAWKTLGPAFKALQISDYATLQSSYVGGYDGRKFVKVCSFLGREDRACLEAAPNPIDAMHPCRIDSSKTKGKTLNWPKVPGDSPLFKVTNRSEEEKASMRQKIQGSWHNKGAHRPETWTIDASGKTNVVRLKLDGTTDKPRATDVFTLSFPRSLEAKRTYASGSSQGVAFFMPDESNFYASGNLLYGAYDMKDGKNFVFKALFDWGIVSDGRCTIVTKPGQVLDATCVKSADTFTVTYQIPGKKRWRKEVLEPTKVVYPIVHNHALAPQLAKMGRFTKTP